MLFNSHVFLCLFLPLQLGLFYALVRRKHQTLAKVVLVAGSFVFYGWDSPSNVIILATSMAVNYGIGLHTGGRYGKIAFIAGIAINISCLFYYKYINFFVSNFGMALNIPTVDISVPLPLGISFYTFEQIYYLCDCRTGKAENKNANFLDYVVFLTFFPRLIAGPIVRFCEMTSQYKTAFSSSVDWPVLARGAFLFSIGLFKKEIIADTLSMYANKGFDESIGLSFIEGWATSLSYTFQLYFDFSGYADMAIGLALLFGVRLPVNFNSPYLALDIQDFWQRWHMTLGRFVRECLYIPLGGNRRGLLWTCWNLLVVFLVIGLWHGAGWLFVFWGLLHGLAMICNRIWREVGRELPNWLAWALTFLFVNAAWVFFRATTWFDAMKILKAMSGLTFFDGFSDFTGIDGQAWMIYTMLGICFGIVFFRTNSNGLEFQFRPTRMRMVLTVLMLGVSYFGLYNKQSFLYFNF